MGLVSEFFSWWGGKTYGLRFTLWKNSRFVGEDEHGNRYFEQARGVGPTGKPRRYVVYDRLAEASLIPSGWHGWMHYKTDTPPDEDDYQAQSFELPHSPNYTGTNLKYRPNAEIRDEGGDVAKDYEAWRPE